MGIRTELFQFWFTLFEVEVQIFQHIILRRDLSGRNFGDFEDNTKIFSLNLYSKLTN